MRTPEDAEREYVENGGPVDDEAFWAGLADDELARRRNNVRALELLDGSHRAHARNLRRASRRLMESAFDAAPDTCTVVLGAIRIGEVPDPRDDPDAWAEYLDGQRDGLARAEAEAPR